MDTKALTTFTNQPAMLAAIDRASLADSTKAQYKKALGRYLDTGAGLTDAGALVAYAEGLPKSSKAFLKAAVRLVTEGLAGAIKANVTPENLDQAQAALLRIEALQEAVKVKAAKGQKSHTWLSQREVKALLAACGNGIVGQRDRVILGLLVAAGLRRAEAAALRFEHIKLQPVGERFRAVLDVKGKGAKDRVIPISDKLADMLDKWRAVVGDGYICRSLGMDREPGDSISEVGIFDVVRRRGRLVGFDGDRRPELAAHDLRRTYAQLGYEAGVSITQISRLLGHASVATTQRYLNLDLDLDTTVSDFIPLE